MEKRIYLTTKITSSSNEWILYDLKGPKDLLLSTYSDLGSVTLRLYSTTHTEDHYEEFLSVTESTVRGKQGTQKGRRMILTLLRQTSRSSVKYTYSVGTPFLSVEFLQSLLPTFQMLLQRLGDMV